MIDNKLYEYMAELLKRTPLDFIRYKYDEINWNGRLIGIVGPRGVGKIHHDTSAHQAIQGRPSPVCVGR